MNFNNGVVKILTKSMREKSLNFGNLITKILAIQNYYPTVTERIPIVAIKLLKFKGREEREKGLWQPSCRKWDEKKREKEL